MQASRRRRRNFFFNSGVQGSVVMAMAVFWLGYHVVMIHAQMFVEFFRQVPSETTAVLALPQFYVEYLRTHYLLLLIGLLALPVMMLQVLNLSHRVLAPLMRFQRAMHEMAQGRRVEPVILRQGDFLQELQEDFNQFLISQESINQGAPVKHNRRSTDRASEEPREMTPSTRSIRESLVFPAG